MNDIATIVLAAMVGAAAGSVGGLMILRRMALVGDALTHVALPGMGIALRAGADPFLGAFSFLFAAVLGIFALEVKTRLYAEAIVGVFFTTALAFGILLVPEHELFEALFGTIADITPYSALLTALFALGAIVALKRIGPAILAATISRELAHTHGVALRKTEFAFFSLIALVTALGIGAVGTLLMGALMILPAIAAKNIGRSFRIYELVSAATGAASAAVGVWLSTLLSIPPGVSVTLVGAAFFLLSFAFRQPR